MKRFICTGFAIAAAHAGPFHKGASWEWVVHDPSLANPTHRFAQVLDSNWSSDKRTLDWLVRVTDSVGQKTADTAIVQEIFESPNGKLSRRVWSKGAPRLPLEPRAFDFRVDSTLGALPYRAMSKPVATEVPWGFGSWVGGAQGKICPSVSSAAMAHPGPLQLKSNCGEGTANTWNVPSMAWDSDRGWGDARWWSGDLSTGLVDWILVAKDGVARLATALGRIQPPRKGAVWTWERRDSHTHHAGPTALGGVGLAISTDSVALVRLNFFDSLSDSSGWSRIDATQDEFAGGTTSKVRARWNQELESRFAKPGFACQDLLEGFRLDWADSKTGSGSARESFRSTVNSAMARSTSSTAFFGKLLVGGGFDSLSCSTSSEAFGAIEPTSDSREVTYRLLRIDNSVFRSSVLIESVVEQIRCVGDLHTLASRYPAANVVVRDAKGAGQTIRLDQLMERGAAPKLGLRWLEVHLPDGSVRRGSMVL